MVEVLRGYSRRGRHKVDQLVTIAALLKRIDADLARPHPPRPAAKIQRYRIADRFSSDELARHVSRYQAGEMGTVLDRESGMAKSTFLRLLAEDGIDTRPRGLMPAPESEILQLRKQGMIIRDIAKHVGCSYGTARKFLLTKGGV